MNPAVSLTVSEECPQSLDLTCQSENATIHRLVFDCNRTLWKLSERAHHRCASACWIPQAAWGEKDVAHSLFPLVCSLLSCYSVNYPLHDECVCNVGLRKQGKWVVRWILFNTPQKLIQTGFRRKAVSRLIRAFWRRSILTSFCGIAGNKKSKDISFKADQNPNI